jgi:hypothetical protein
VKQFSVIVPNKPGSLANVCDALTRGAVNIKAISTEVRMNGNSIIRMVTDDEESTKASLDKGRFSYTVNNVLVAELLDRPGELAKASRKMARAGVNIDSVYILGTDGGKVRLALTVDKYGEAKKAI